MDWSGFIQKTGILILMAYIAVAVFGLIPMAPMENTGMTHSTDCPYTAGMQAICDTGFSHIRGWQAFSNGIISHFELLLALVLVSLLPPTRTVLASRIFVRFRRRNKYIPKTIYQELFSSGILNPKNP